MQLHSGRSSDRTTRATLKRQSAPSSALICIVPSSCYLVIIKNPLSSGPSCRRRPELASRHSPAVPRKLACPFMCRFVGHRYSETGSTQSTSGVGQAAQDPIAPIGDPARAHPRRLSEIFGFDRHVGDRRSAVCIAYVDRSITPLDDCRIAELSSRRLQCHNLPPPFTIFRQ